MLLIECGVCVSLGVWGLQDVLLQIERHTTVRSRSDDIYLRPVSLHSFR